MAIARVTQLCIRCGKPLKALHRNRGKFFVGDTFIGWDYHGHKCDTTTDAYKKWLAREDELEAFWKSPEGQKKKAEFQAILEEPAKRRTKQVEAEKTDMDKLDEFLHSIADLKNVGIRRKVLAIRKYIDALSAQ